MANTPLPPLPPRPSWRLLVRAIGAASDPRSLILAALGVVTLQAGWSALALIFGFTAIDGSWTPFDLSDLPSEGLYSFLLVVLRPVYRLFYPVIASFRPDIPGVERFYFVLCSFWSLVVWSLFGCAIVRIAVVRVATSARVGLLSALKFSLARMGTLVAAPLVPLGVACLFAVLGVAVGLLDRVIPALATALAFIPLIVGLIDAVILLGLAGAWPLMVATVAAEGEDFFDAVSRSYSYVNQQTVRYAAYLGLATLLGGLGLIAVHFFATTALALADWSISLGAPRNVGFRFGTGSSVAASGLPAVARSWRWLVEIVISGWTSSYLWTTAAIIYLVLRRDVDGSEIHDIYHPIQEADTFVPDEAAAINPVH